MEKFSFDKASKFHEKDRFFDINYVWTPKLDWVVEKLYYTSIRPEAIIVLSLVAGGLAGWYYSKGDYISSLLGIIFIQLKNYLDTVDGHIARAKGIDSRLGRFLDSLADAFAYLFLFTGIALHLMTKGYGPLAFLLSYAAMLVGFILCSVYCYYIVSYKTCLMGGGINRTDESMKEEEKLGYQKTLFDRFLYFLHLLYIAIYGWQDKFAAALDQKAMEKMLVKNPGLSRESVHQSWYTDKKFLSTIAPLCFGTQIMMLSLFTIFDCLAGFLWFLITVGNGYALWIVFRGRRIKVGP